MAENITINKRYTDIINKCICNIVQANIDTHVNNEQTVVKDLDVFNYDHILKKAQSHITKPRNIKELPSLMAVQKFLDGMNLGIKIYYGYLNTVRINTTAISIHNDSNVFTFYTNTNLLLDVRNPMGCNDSYVSIRFYSKNKDIDFGLTHKRSTGDNLVEMLPGGHPSTQNIGKNKQIIEHKLIKYMNPCIYNDFLLTCDESVVAGAFNIT